MVLANQKGVFYNSKICKVLSFLLKKYKKKNETKVYQ
jgi:hypothetical protein